MHEHKQKIIFSSENDDWETPLDLWLILHKKFKFTFDPCPLVSTFDGLEEKWLGSIFINPPYSNIANFFKKGLAELAEGNAHTLVFLVPARTDTKWFHQYAYENILPKKATYILKKGRVSFKNGNKETNSAPFPSVICIFPPMSDKEEQKLREDLIK